ncbi:MAG: hypothetical protein J6X33_08570 [Clostridiales bacterium]|nr:hypothetical protein [Clostridiales bacterium]
MRRFPFRQVIAYTVYIILVFCIQVSYSSEMSFMGQIPDLMFVFTVLTAYYFGFRDGVIVGLILGLLRDCFCAPCVTGLDGSLVVTCGIGMLVMFLAASVASAFFTGRMKRNVPFSFVTVAVVTMLYKLSGYVLTVFWYMTVSRAGNAESFTDHIVRSLLPQTGLNLLAAVPLVFLLKFLGPYKRGPAKNREDDKIISGEGNWVTY